MAYFPADGPGEIRTRRGKFAEQLTRATSWSNLDVPSCLDGEHLWEDVSAIAGGILKAEILEGAASAIPGNYIPSRMSSIIAGMQEDTAYPQSGPRRVRREDLTSRFAGTGKSLSMPGY